MKKRFLAALTAILLLSASCSNGSGEAADPSEALTSPTGQTPTADLAAETEPEITDGLPEADYEGADITIWGDTAEYDVFYDADLTGDVVNDAIFNRNSAVSDRFNVRLTYNLDASKWRNQQELINTVTSGSEIGRAHV